MMIFHEVSSDKAEKAIGYVLTYNVVEALHIYRLEATSEAVGYMSKIYGVQFRYQCLP